MRIFHAADFGNTVGGGFIPMLGALSERLNARGDSMALAVPAVPGAGWHAEARKAGIELHVVANAWEAAHLARAWQPDIAHVHFFGWELPVTARLWTSRARVIWHIHSTSLRIGGAMRTLRTRAKYRIAGARVSRFVTVSRAIGDEIVALGAPRRRVLAIHNAVDGAHFRAPSDEERAAARAAYGVDGPAVLFFGREPYIKGTDVLVGALREMTPVHVLAVGTPEPLAGVPERHRVITLPRTRDVRSLYWAADALALPSRGEGYSLALIEAALCGTPIVASDLPALREGGEGRPAVRLVPPADEHALAAALMEALRSGRARTQQAPGDDLASWAERVTSVYDSA